VNNIFRIKNDNFRFQEPTLDIEDVLDYFPEDYSELDALKFSYNNIGLSAWWNDTALTFKNIEGATPAPIPDICTWIDATLIISSKAYDLVAEELKPFGEFLPLTFNGNRYFIFNCLTVGQADEINSKQDIQNGAYMGVKRLQFNSTDVIHKTVFKTPFNRCMDLFCNDKFKNIIEKSHLQGIAFDENLAGHF